MTRYPTRRGALLLLAGAAIPAVARSQEPTPAPAPQVTTPVIPPIGAPTPPAAPSAPPAAAMPPHPAPPVAIDKTKAYYVFFDQNIDVASMRTLRRQVGNLAEAGVAEINLVIESAGGMVEPTIITYSFLRALPVKINTHALGFVASSAVLLYLAGQERSADRNARFLFHPSQSQVNGAMGEPQLRERLEVFGTAIDMMGQIFRERTSLPASEIERFARETVIYTAEQARGFGVVQTVADLRIPDPGRARIMFLD